MTHVSGQITSAGLLWYRVGGTVSLLRGSVQASRDFPHGPEGRFCVPFCFMLTGCRGRSLELVEGFTIPF